MLPSNWSFTRKVQLAAAVIGMLGVCMLSGLLKTTRQPMDFSDPGKFLVRTRDQDGKEIVLERVNSFADDFETVISRKIEGWHQEMKLSSGSKPGAPANNLQTTTEQVHTGMFSLKTQTSQDAHDLQKAALLRELFFFPPHSDFWFSAWYYIPGQSDIENLFLFDLEATANDGLGRRLMLTGSNGRYLMLEGKQSTGPQYAQTTSPVPFPRDQWVHLKLHLHLSTGAEGRVELWQDGMLILDKQGPNIPPDTFYDRIEVGQTANSTHQALTVYVDDVRVSDKPIDD
ncbi:heparin lyase I family protein [Planctomicrobium piriforme]|nr:heparin lyase I family protein [Planctomicrobium piriforme]